MKTLNTSRYDVVIVGGGFSGAVLAAHLLRRAPGGISVAVVERSPLRARGIAYSTRVEAHLLNVPAGKMSAFPDESEHFLRWAQKHYDADVEARSFVPRRVYGEYIDATLRDAQRSSNGRVDWIQDEAVAVTHKGAEAELSLADGSRLSAERVVLALGISGRAIRHCREGSRRANATFRLHGMSHELHRRRPRVTFCWLVPD